MKEDMLLYIKNHSMQFMKFVTVGIITFIINFSFFHLLFGIYKINYQIAVSCSYVAAIVSHFTLNRFITFKSNDHISSATIFKYAGVLVLNYFVTLTLMWAVVNIAKTSPYIGIVVATAMTAINNFFIMKYFVFKNNMSIDEIDKKIFT